MSLFVILKFIHVLSSMIAFGTNVTYNLLLANAIRHPETTIFALKTIKLLDSRLANPAYGVALLAGMAMVFTVPFPITTPWILASIVLYLTIAALGIKVYAPTFRQQLKLAETEGTQSSSYIKTAQKGKNLIFLVTFLVAIIIYLMVAKPPLWSAWF